MEPKGRSSPRVLFSGASFVVGGKAFLVIGVSVWQYDPKSNQWNRKNDMPGADKRNGFGFSIGDKGYIGGGFYGTNEFYEYDPAGDQWTRRKGIPRLCPTYNDSTVHALENVTFTIGSKAYVTGTNLALWEYDPSTDLWRKKIDNHIATYAAASSLGQTGYCFNCKGEMWRYDPVSNHLTLGSPFPGTQVCYPAGFSIDGNVYIGLGGFFSNKGCTLTTSSRILGIYPCCPDTHTHIERRGHADAGQEEPGATRARCP